MKIRVVNPTGSRRGLRRRAKRKLSGGGGVFIVARKARRSRRRRIGGSRHRRRQNPAFFGFKRRHHRRRRNPGGLSGGLRGIGSLIVWGGAGAVASRALPSMLLSSMDSSWTGYALNAGTAFVGGMLVSKFAGPDAGQKFTAGGVISVVLRVVTDFFGSQLGLSGLGYYIENNFPLPTAGSGPYLLNPGYSGSPMPSVGASAPALPAVATVAGAPAVAGTPNVSTDTPGRWSDRWQA